MDFILRIYKRIETTTLADIQHIALSGLPIISKQTKFDGVCLHKSFQKKYGYSVEVKNPNKICKVAGSHTYPVIGFKGEYLDVVVKNFPRYPAIYADYHICRNIMNSNDAKHYMLNMQFPTWMKYRQFEILPLNENVLFHNQGDSISN